MSCNLFSFYMPTMSFLGRIWEQESFQNHRKMSITAETEDTDLFDRLPHSLIILVLNKIGDVKALCRCCVVSKRFRRLVRQVEYVVVRVDFVISDDGVPSRSGVSRIVVGGDVKPIQDREQVLGPSRSSLSSSSSPLSVDGGEVTHLAPTQVLKNFYAIRSLKIELPSSEFGKDDDVMLKWRAEFASTLDYCVILGASSEENSESNEMNHDEIGGIWDEINDNGSIPDSFYTDGSLKLRVVWTISSLIAMSARHYWLPPIVAEHRQLEVLLVSDPDGQGVLCMDGDQMEELRYRRYSASSASKRTILPAMDMRLWYAPYLSLPDGTVLKGATLVAVTPSHEPKQEIFDTWLSSAIEEPYGSAARSLAKRKSYSLDINPF